MRSVLIFFFLRAFRLHLEGDVVSPFAAAVAASAGLQRKSGVSPPEPSLSVPLPLVAPTCNACRTPRLARVDRPDTSRPDVAAVPCRPLALVELSALSPRMLL